MWDKAQRTMTKDNMIPNHSSDPRQPFFDTIAEAWDGWHDLAILTLQLNAAFERFGVQPSETVVDIGCGTGNLTQALLPHLGPDGAVVALDISPAMLQRAQGKITDARVTWCETSADRIPMADASCDRAICFSAWPHFEHPDAVIAEIRRVLRPGGHAHILHLISKEAVNRIHSEAHPSVHADHLAPVGEVAAQFQLGGFVVLETQDDAAGYRLTAQKRCGV